MLGSRVYRSLSPGTHYFPEGVEKLELLVAAPLQDGVHWAAEWLQDHLEKSQRAYWRRQHLYHALKD